MAPFTVYFDDSGTHPESNTAVAACYVSTPEKWTRFETEWREIAVKEGFETFHMVDFAAGRGEFEGWDDAKRRHVLGRLCSLINIRVRTGFIAGVRKLDYDDLIKEDQKILRSIPLQFCTPYLRNRSARLEDGV